MPTSLTPEQILALAPDASAAQAGRGLSSPRTWERLGSSEIAVWGECKGSGKDPYRVQVDLHALAFRCSCPSRKFPCKHGLGLLLLYAAQPVSFPASPPPEWVAEWLQKRASAQSQPAASPARPPPAEGPSKRSKGKSALSREALVAAGLDELDRWLRDQLRQGLAVVQSRGPAAWEAVAARMVDAQAPGVARRLRELGEIAHSGAGWQSRVLERIAQLHLLSAAYRRLDTLPAPLQAEVRTQIGWNQSQEALKAGPLVRDRWLAVGQQLEEQDKLRTLRTWLWGLGTGQAALLLTFAAGGQQLERPLPLGTVVDADLAFYAGALEQRGLLVTRHAAPIALNPADAPHGTAALLDASAAYSAALAGHPWLEQFPLLLSAVTPLHQADRWLLRDAAGNALPLSVSGQVGWQLLALSGGAPITVFGEWDGAQLRPLSVLSAGELHRIKP